MPYVQTTMVGECYKPQRERVVILPETGLIPSRLPDETGRLALGAESAGSGGSSGSDGTGEAFLDSLSSASLDPGGEIVR